MADEITTNSKTPATEPTVSDVQAEPASEPIQPVDSFESAGGILPPEEISTEPANSPLENPIETNPEIQFKNTVEEPTVQTQEPIQEIPQANEVKQPEPEVQTEAIKPEQVKQIPQIQQVQTEEPTIQIQKETQENFPKIEPKPLEPVIQDEAIKPEQIKVEVPKNVEISNLSEGDRRLLDSFKLNMKRARELLVKARMAIQFRKRKKLDKIMTLFQKKNEIRNDDVEKLLHVSDATATVYLSILKKENKIKPSGKKGTKYSYIKI